LDRLENSLGQISTDAERRNLLGALAAMRAFHLLQTGLAEQAVQKADEAEMLLSEDRYFSRTMVPFIHGTRYRMQARYAEAALSFDKFLERSWSWGEIWNMMMSSYEASMTARYRGRLNEASNHYFRAIAEVNRRSVCCVGSSCKIYGNFGEILYEQNRLDEVLQLLSNYLDGGDNWILPTDILVALSPVIKTYIAQKNHEAAELLLNRAYTILDSNMIFPRIIALFHDLRIRYCIATKTDIKEPHLQFSYDLDLIGITQALEACEIRWLWHTGSHHEAQDRAGNLARAAYENGGMALFIEAKALEAVAAWGGGDKVSALKEINKAIDAGRTELYTRSFADLGQSMLELLSAFCKDAQTTASSLCTEYAQRLVSILKVELGEPASSARPSAAGRLISSRENEVLLLIEKGYSNKEIAEYLYISEGTVKTHIHHLAEKLEAANRTSIVARAREENLI